MTSYHPDGHTVDIVGIIASDRGRNCHDHPFCGEIVKLDVVVRFRREMINVAGGTNGGPGREEPAIVVYWVTDGIDACRIGFLPRHMNHHAARYDGVLGQITGMFSAGQSGWITSGPWSIRWIKSWNSIASWHTSLGGRCDTFVPMRYTIE
jgi:hypothetical protein